MKCRSKFVEERKEKKRKRKKIEKRNKLERMRKLNQNSNSIGRNIERITVNINGMKFQMQKYFLKRKSGVKNKIFFFKLN